MFSIVIPLYNKQQHIAQTIESVLSQTFQDFEIIVVDDGSTDNSVFEVKKFDDKRIRIVSQKNAGVSAARNRGIEEAKYEMIAFLDADDEWTPDYLKKQNELISKYSHSSIFSLSYIFSKEGVKSKPRIVTLPFNRMGIVNYFCIAYRSDPPICASAVVIRKDALKQIGGFPVGIASGEDLITWAKLSVLGNVAYLNEAHSIYHLDNGLFDPGRLPDEDDYVGKELIKLWKAKTQDLCLKKYIAYWYKIRSAMYLQNKKRLKAFQASIKALSYDPFTMKNYRYLLLSFLPYSLIKLIFKYKVENQ